MKKNGLSSREMDELYKTEVELHKGDEAFKKRENIDFYIYLAIVLIAALSIRLFVFEPVRVEGPSMEPTLWTNERLFVEKLSYCFESPERGQVLICRYPDERENCVKRVIALPGETVKVSWGKVYVNGEPLDESAYWNDIVYSDMPELTVPENSVFVMGDNRNVSKDSRAASVGPIPYSRIVGRAHFVMWPFSNWRDI